MSPARLALSLLLLCGNLQVNGLQVSRPEPFVFGSAAAAAQAGDPADRTGAVDAGQARMAALAFRGTRMEVAWILFPAQRKGAFLDAFAARHGQPSLQLDLGVVLLAAGATGLRSAPAGRSTHPAPVR